MSNKEKPVELIPDTSVASGWKVKHDNKVGDKPGNGPGSYPVVEFAKDSGPHLVVLQIPADKPGTFSDTGDPIWIQPGSSSPTRSGIDPQFADWAVLDGGKTLVLLDLNTQAGDYYYRVDAKGYNKVLDPIIKNGGTSVTPPSTTTSTAQYGTADYLTAAAALLLAFLAGYFVRRLFAPKSNLMG